ncbi:hypothetical protein [Actinomadura rubrisoli]|uniref:Uncharacterized protein n=1 Tax=Actinomadura rubrisoli TaxID=2530368 RepID=A0A4R5CIN8_9ACTN|nr:hypothetical protein [Actinomadura rubrisoli]TDD97204.1 hypothetical protein E1298_01845 [Actinomadura rubrisoli]
MAYGIADFTYAGKAVTWIENEDTNPVLGRQYHCAELRLSFYLTPDGRYRGEVWHLPSGACEARLYDRNTLTEDGKETLISYEEYDRHVYGAKPFEDLAEGFKRVHSY